MVSLRLESDDDSLDLDGVEANGYGVQAVSGATGFGLPPRQVQWVSGAGDGAKYRGRRILPRSMDIPFYVRAHSHVELKQYMSRLARILSDQPRLIFSDDDDPGNDFYQYVACEGGGDYTYGEDTRGNKDVKFDLTLTAGDPFFTSMNMSSALATAAAKAGLLTGGSFSALQLASGQSIGALTLQNDGDATAYPIWTITGPGTGFTATSSTGESFTWSGTLAAGDVLTIDTRPGTGTAYDNHGVNRYSDFASAPKLWALPEGTTIANISLGSASTTQSSILCQWSTRKWVVI